MKLPDYFIADLPREAVITSGLVSEACQTLKRNAQRYLATRTTQQIIHVLEKLGRDWLNPDFAFRKQLLEAAPAATGFSAPILADGLDSLFSQLNAENLENLLIQELGNPHALDKLAPSGDRTALARGPQLQAHIASGNLPNPILVSILFGLLVKSAQFVKCASGQSFIPRLFAHSIYEADAKLGACLEIAEWRGGSHELETALFAEADCVTATGSDETLAAIRKHLSHKTRFIGYGTRVSFGYVTSDILTTPHPREIVRRAARDVIAWNQLGCLSPHVIYVENNGSTSPETFAHLLAEELDLLEATHPRGTLTPHEAAAITTRRSLYEIRAAHSIDTKMWASNASTAWTVIFENDPQFQPSCLNRFVYVKAVSGLDELLRVAEPIREHVSTVGLAATQLQSPTLAHQLALWGVTRICPLGQMQNPPLGWRHDGRPALADLVTWSEWERK